MNISNMNSMLRRALAVPAAILLGTLSVFPAPKDKVDLDVQYGPTPPSVIREMIRMADVTKNDTVYDLGCGDGRIVIATAKQTGASGVGVDIDPKRIRQSLRNAEKARVAGRVKFIQQDLFAADIRQATVVMLFLNPAVNVRVRPKLLHELKPGTRVVSHHHLMGTWKPDVVSGAGGRPVYLWVIPASLEGSWDLTYSDGKAQRRYTFQAVQTFQEFEATLSGKFRSNIVSETRLSGDEVTFSSAFPDADGSAVYVFNGRIRGNDMEGTMNNGTTTYRWKAHRKADEPVR